MASTPPPPSTVTVPDAPLHGPMFDSPSNNSLRKSSRLSNKQRSERTPSPELATSFDSEAPGELKRTPRAARRARNHLSPPSSPIDHDDMVALTRSASKKASSAYNLAAPARDASSLGLPTPVKTPRKKALQPGSSSTARVLFGASQQPQQGLMAAAYDDVLTPSRRNNARRPRKHVGFSLDDDDLDGQNGRSIEIYTDSKEKIPELDLSEDNPFYVSKATQTAGKASNKRKRIEHDPSVEKRLARGVKDMQEDEGMVYVHRGRKVYKKFDAGGPSSPLHQSDAEVEASNVLANAHYDEEDSPTHTHYTRSSIKPRRLFASDNPTHASGHDMDLKLGTTTDEEAVTDIEDPEKHGMTVFGAGKAQREKKTRQKNVSAPAAVNVAHVASPGPGPASPFAAWPRKKNGSSRAVSMKREGEGLESQPKRVKDAPK